MRTGGRVVSRRLGLDGSGVSVAGAARMGAGPR
jgi:hypothetical protein